MSDTPRPLTPPTPFSPPFSPPSGYDSGRHSRIHSHHGSNTGSRTHSPTRERTIETEPFVDQPSFVHNTVIQPPVVRPANPHGVNQIPYPYKPHKPPFRDV